jgi:hypothetical protein
MVGKIEPDGNKLARTVKGNSKARLSGYDWQTSDIDGRNSRQAFRRKLARTDVLDVRGHAAKISFIVDDAGLFAALCPVPY